MRKYLGERHGVLDAVEVQWDLEPVSEAVPLLPGCGVLVELGIGEAFGDSCMCSIVCSRHFAADGRRNILQGEGWGKVEWKCLRKSRTGRWVSRDVASDSWLLSPVIRLKDA